jgi:predicted ATPase
MLTIKAKNYRGLQDIDWKIPQGLSVLIGPNGAGKSTLLNLPEFLLTLTEDEKGADLALKTSGGATTLRHKKSKEEVISFEVQFKDLLWELRLVTTPNGGLTRFPYERISSQNQPLFERLAGVEFGKWKGKDVASRQVSALKRVANLSSEDNFVGNPLLMALRSYMVYCEYDLFEVKNGTEDNKTQKLFSGGSNLFTVLRNWGDTPEDLERRQFVTDNLRECFPFFRDLEFAQGGSFIEGFFRHPSYPKKEDRFPMRAAPSGFLVAMMHLCAVAGTDPGEVIAIDDFESCLHPEAITKLLTAIEEDATARNISVIIATQSPQVLNFFDDKPEKVYIVDDRLQPSPRPLIEVKNPDWLSHFRLGEKFMEGSFAGFEEH